MDLDKKALDNWIQNNPNELELGVECKLGVYCEDCERFIKDFVDGENSMQGMWCLAKHKLSYGYCGKCKIEQCIYEMEEAFRDKD